MLPISRDLLNRMKPPAEKWENPFPKRLQAVALQLFWENGYRATSTRDIAAALGVKQGSLYYYVKNKEELLHAICYSSLQHVMETVVAAASGASGPADALRRILDTHLRSCLEQQKQFFVSIADYRSLSPSHVEQIKIFWRDHQMLVSDVLDQGKAISQIRQDIPNRYLYFISINTLHWTVMWFRSSGSLTPEQLAAMYTQVLVDGAATTAARESGRLKNLIRQTAHTMRPPIDVGSNSTHARVFDVASRLFAQQGFSNTSMREIATTVGIEKASLYHYLSSKDDLNYEISRSAHEHLCQNVQQAISLEARPEEKLYSLIVVHVTSLLQHQDWHATANEQLNTLPEAHRRAIITMRDEYESEIRRVISEAQAYGFLRSDFSAKSLGMILLGMMTHIYPWYEAGKDISSGELGKLIADLFFSGMSA